MSHKASRAEPVPRTSARVVLLDETDRLLLFSSTDDSDGHTFWFTIGGGNEANESLRETAMREAREEVGLTGFSLGPEIWRRRRLGSWGGIVYDCHEHFFLARVAAFDVDTAGFTDLERSTVTGHRWWTLDELYATTDRLGPGNLPVLLEELLTSGPPDAPITLTT